ncbi:porin [Methylobacterium sp. NEAU K]|uniref:porin n=1 Tax=Methylobacterium sp. NEAU K TaxID=3064946 RepID=UPI0027377779|nr:porin [Methylobacterium sp. NEAU K]MDP4003122.1 porin [Methylobacterium sp. NEAU K]
MKLLKSSLLGSAAVFAAVGSVHAADLPVKKAAPVEFVRVCNAYGAGFFYIPGTDTCLRLSGRARMEYLYQNSGNRSGTNGDVSGFRSIARINLDARTQTAYGTLRAFTRIEVQNRTGPYFTSGSRQREGLAFAALGADAFGRAQTYVDIDKAFIQFAGITAGRASSFFDFYAHDFEFIGGTTGSDTYSTNLLAYTATLGGGLSATISAEDPTYRRYPTFGSGSNSAAAPLAFSGGFAPFGSATFLAPIVVGTNQIALVDVTQKNRVPDVVGVLRLDQAWGSLQLSAASHEINGGNASFVSTSNTGGLTIASAGRAPTTYGWAVQAGGKFNLPFIAPGDALYLQGAYSEGANAYTGMANYTYPYDAQSAGPFSGASFITYNNDAVINPATGKYTLAQSFTVVASYLHYWSPEWRSAFYGSYGEVSYNKSARAALGTIGFGFNPTNSGANANAFVYSPTLRDNNLIVAGASLIWSPVKDLDIGVEGAYIRAALNNGLTNDINKNPSGLNVNGVPVKLIGATDTFQTRFRIQRDF